MQATPYTRATDFADDERNNAGGRSTVRTAQIDAELDGIATPLNQTIANLAVIQRDDQEMRDGMVKPHTFSADSLKLLGAIGTVRGAWATATLYSPKDVVTQYGNTYVCVVAHTSGSFDADLTAVKWILVQLAPNIVDAITLQSSTGLSDGVMITARGRTSRDDGGGGIFQYWASSAATADGVVTITPLSGSGRFIRMGWRTYAAGGTVPAAFAGVKGDGNDETAAITLLEGGAWSYVDLQGMSVVCTQRIDLLTKSYFNGTLTGASAISTTTKAERVSPISATEVQRPWTKSPITGWPGKSILWLGTSIPAQGMGVDGYPELAAHALQATVSNMAWAGSHATYIPTDSALDIATVKALSMTADDVAWGLATFGPSSAYSDTFDPITLASQQTIDYRIGAKMAAQGFDLVVIDHNHNDRYRELGTLTPASVSITSLGLGATTTVNVGSGTFAVGDAVVLRVTGVPFADYLSARVQAVSDGALTLNVNSSAFAGSFTSGTCTKVDRSTLAGAFQFIISYSLNMAVRYGRQTPKFALCSSPYMYTQGAYAPSVYSNARHLQQIAAAWGAGFFDVAYHYDVPFSQGTTYFPDNVHPLTAESRVPLANHWVRWLSGGEITQYTPSDFLVRGGTDSYSDQREAIYSKYRGGFATMPFVIGASTTVVSEDFASISDWTTGGAVTPTTAAAPWNGSLNSMLCAVTATNTSSWIQKTSLSLGGGGDVQFDLYLPSVSGLTTGSTKTVEIFRTSNTALSDGNQYSLQLNISATQTWLSLRYFTTPVNDGYATLPVTTVPLAAGVVNTVKLEWVKATSEFNGGFLLWLNGTVISTVTETVDSAQPNPDTVRLGVNSSNTGASFSLYMANLTVRANAVEDYTDRYTGTFTADTQTVTVVNGIITSVA